MWTHVWFAEVCHSGWSIVNWYCVCLFFAIHCNLLSFTLVCGNCQVLQQKRKINFYISFKLIYLKPVTGQTITWNDNVLKHWCFLWNQNGLCMFWLLYVTCNGFSMTGIMDSHWHLIKNLKCEQFMKFDKRHGKLWSIADCWRKFPRLVWPTFRAVDMTQQTSPPSPANAENNN